MTATEFHIDGIVGPTHNYAGLSYGNVASEKHALSISNPKQAALQGLQKMKFLHDLGIPQLVMPPHPRPAIGVLKKLGYHQLTDVPTELLHSVYSASNMWVANAATISPSSDTEDGKVHFTPANLISKFHRSIEPPVTASYLKQIFIGDHFIHHDPLPEHALFADEGAANHIRLSRNHGERGIEIFVYGGEAKKYPARQSRHACEAITRLHRLDSARTILLEQNAQAIDAGVFHNDVIAMSNEQLFIYHEKAYTHMDERLADFEQVIIREKDLSLSDAVDTYFFNSQLITLPSGKMRVIAPKECENNSKAKTCFERLIEEGHIEHVHYLDVRESMKNGGGPACLRLRVVLTPKEQKGIRPEVRLSDNLYQVLCQWIEKHYRDKVAPDDLRDAALAEESAQALAELSQLLKINIGSHDQR